MKRDHTFYYKQSSAFEGEGDFAQAVANFTKAIELKPDFAIAYHDHGVISYKVNHLDCAIRDFTKAIELKPRYA